MKKNLIISIFVGNDLSSEELCQRFSRILQLVSDCGVKFRRQDCRGLSQVQYIADKLGDCDIQSCCVLALIPGLKVTPDIEADTRRRLSWKLGAEFHAAAIDRIDFVNESK